MLKVTVAALSAPFRLTVTAAVGAPLKMAVSPAPGKVVPPSGLVQFVTSFQLPLRLVGFQE